MCRVASRLSSTCVSRFVCVARDRWTGCSGGSTFHARMTTDRRTSRTRTSQQMWSPLSLTTRQGTLCSAKSDVVFVKGCESCKRRGTRSNNPTRLCMFPGLSKQVSTYCLSSTCGVSSGIMDSGGWARCIF